MTISTTGLFLLIIFPALLGILLFVLGWVGKRINNHPICRECHYDLIGADSASTRCPECGANIENEHAIYKGERRRRPYFLAGGSALVLLACGLIALSLWAPVNNINWNQYKPDWWLTMNTESGDQHVVGDALLILRERYKKDSLSSSHVQTLIKRGLDKQADQSELWLPSWGDLIEEAWAKSDLTGKEKTRYAKGVISFEFHARNRIPQNAESDLQLNWSADRTGTREDYSTIPPSTPAHILQYSIQQQTVQIDNDPSFRRRSFVSGTLSGNSGMSVHMKNSSPPGKHQIRLHTYVRIALDYKNSPSDRTQSLYLDKDPTHYVEIPIDLTTSFETVPTGTPIVQTVIDPQLLTEVIRTTRFGYIHTRLQNEHLEITGMLAVRDMPTAMAFDVLMIDADGHEWNLGSLTAVPNTGVDEHGAAISADITGFNSQYATIILRSNPALALSHLDINEILEGEIIFPNMRIYNNQEYIQLTGDTQFSSSLFRGHY